MVEMSVQRISLLLLLISLQAVHRVDARGVLSIKLLSFENPKGRTYEGQCCDPSPLDGDTCHDKCDYVMRLIIAGLGRANDHVFLFHRPLKYDSNDLSFQEHGGDLTLTVLFDQWPADGHVKMNAFFYDYDDFDHTTALVDWFETELSSDGKAWQGHSGIHVRGNRQEDKTRLVFQWSRHCAGGLEDDTDCLSPPPDWTFWPWEENESETDSEHRARLTTDDGQRVVYRNKKKEGHVMKSPFRPFSTRKTDLHRMVSSHSPAVANDGYLKVTAGPGPARGNSARSEYQKKFNRERQKSVFVKDPQNVVKGSKVEKFLDKDVSEAPSSPRKNVRKDGQQRGPGTQTIVDHSRPRHRPMTPPKFKKNEKVMAPKIENPVAPRRRFPPGRNQKTTTPVVHRRRKQHDGDADANRSEVGTETTTASLRSNKVKKPEVGVGKKTLPDLNSAEREISKAMNMMKARKNQRPETSKPTVGVTTTSPVTKRGRHVPKPEKKHNVELKSPFAPSTIRPSTSTTSHVTKPRTTEKTTVSDKRSSRRGTATRKVQKKGKSTEDKLEESAPLSPKITTKKFRTPIASATTSTIAASTTTPKNQYTTTTTTPATSTDANLRKKAAAKTTARPAGWGPDHKNRFVTWIPATPSVARTPKQNYELSNIKVKPAVQRVVKDKKESDLKTNQRNSRRRPQQGRQRPSARKPTKQNQRPVSPAPSGGNQRQAGQNRSTVHKNTKSAHDVRSRKQEGKHDAKPTPLRKVEFDATTHIQQTSGTATQGHVLTTPATKLRTSKKVTKANPLQIHKKQREWLKQKKIENMRQKLPEPNLTVKNKPAKSIREPLAQTTPETTHKIESRTRATPFTMMTTPNVHQQHNQLASNVRTTSAVDATSSNGYATTPLAKTYSRSLTTKPTTDKPAKQLPTTPVDETVMRKFSSQRTTVGTSTTTSVPVSSTTKETTTKSLLSRHIDLVRAIETADQVEKATTPLTIKSHPFAATATRTRSTPDLASTAHHHTVQNVATTPNSSRRRSQAPSTKPTTATTLTTTPSGQKSEATDLFVSTETSTTPFTITRQPDNAAEEADASSTRAESMKRVKTQTFQTPTEVMWYVTTHPAYARTTPRYADVEIRHKDKPSREQKYKLPKESKSPFEKPEIRVKQVTKQEKSADKKKRKYQPGLLKSRLDLVEEFTRKQADTDSAPGRNVKDKPRKNQKSPFSVPEIKTSTITTPSRVTATAPSRVTATATMSAKTYRTTFAQSKSAKITPRKSPFEPSRRSTVSETTVVSSTTATPRSYADLKSSVTPVKLNPVSIASDERRRGSLVPVKKAPSVKSPFKPADTKSTVPPQRVATLEPTTESKQSNSKPTDQWMKDDKDSVKTVDLQKPVQSERESGFNMKNTKLSQPTLKTFEFESKVNKVDSPNKPATSGPKRTKGRRKENLRDLVKKLNQMVPADLSHKNPFLNKNTQGQATLPLHRSSGRVSSLYTSSVNGTKINSSLVTKDRQIVPPLPESAPKGGSKYGAETGLKRVDAPVSGTNAMQRPVKTPPNKPRNLSDKTNSIEETSRLLESTLKMLKDSTRKRVQESGNGSQTPTTHPMSSAFSKVTLQTTSHSDGSTSSSGFARASPRSNFADSSIKGLPSLSAKPAQSTVDTLKSGSTRASGLTKPTERPLSTRLSSATVKPRDKSLSTFSSPKTTPKLSYSSLLPVNKQTKSHVRNAATTSPVASNSTTIHQPSMNSVAARSRPTKTHHRPHKFPALERNVTEAESLKTKPSTPAPHQSSRHRASSQSTRSTPRERETTLMAVSRMHETNTSANASLVHETRAESIRPSEDRSTSINRTRDPSLRVYPQDIEIVTVTGRTHPASVLSSRPRESQNATQTVTPGRGGETKHSTTPFSESASVDTTTSTRSEGLFTKTAPKRSTLESEIFGFYTTNLKKDIRGKKGKYGTKHPRTSQTKSAGSSAFTSPSASHATAAADALSTNSEIPHTRSTLASTTLKGEGHGVFASTSKPPSQKSAENKKRDSLLSLFNNLANIISSSIATVKNSSLEASSVESGLRKKASASIESSPKSSTTVTVSGKGTTLANTTSTPEQNTTEEPSPSVSERRASLTTVPTRNSTEPSISVVLKTNLTTVSSTTSLPGANTTSEAAAERRTSRKTTNSHSTVATRNTTASGRSGVNTTSTPTNTSSTPESATQLGTNSTTKSTVGLNATIHSSSTTHVVTQTSTTTNAVTTEHPSTVANSTRNTTRVTSIPAASSTATTTPSAANTTAEMSPVATTDVAVNTTSSTTRHNSTTPAPTTTTTQKSTAEATTPKKIKLTLPAWITFPNKFRNFQNSFKTTTTTPTTSTTTTTTTTTTSTTTTTTAPTVAKATPKLKVKGKDLDNVKLPENILKALEDQFLGRNKGLKTILEGSIGSETVKVQESHKNLDSVKSQDTIKIIPTLPSIEMLLNVSEPGPKVIVPEDGLFEPEFDHHGNSSHGRTGVSGSRERHVGIHLQKMSVGTVFNRYWPAILGLTVGTVFLVVALLTSIACRQQRLFVQRRQWQQDTPQYLTEPPDTSEYTSSSASSLVSDNTRSSINFT